LVIDIINIGYTESYNSQYADCYQIILNISQCWKVH